jgi:hypothetical protein
VESSIPGQVDPALLDPLGVVFGLGDEHPITKPAMVSAANIFFIKFILFYLFHTTESIFKK